MMLARALCEGPIRFELAAVKLLPCAQAVGANHQTTPMTRASAASTRGEFARCARKPYTFPTQPSPDLVPICYVAMFFVALTAFLAAALTLATHPLAAVLLALGAMSIFVHISSEFNKGRI
jgi:hypothetical protein